LIVTDTVCVTEPTVAVKVSVELPLFVPPPTPVFTVAVAV
jgi:hypothetical protein